MDRAEKRGIGVAAAGHVALFALLSLGLLSAKVPRPPLADTMDVTIADEVGLKSAAPVVSQDAPAPSEAADQGAPEDAAPPPPAPEPEPAPTPAPPPKPVPPAPKPKPTPAKIDPKPEVKPEPKPEPKPEKPKPEKPKPEKTKPAPEKPTPAKPTKTTAAGKASAKPATKAGLPSDFLNDLPKDSGTGKTGTAAKAKGSRLGKDFLKGLSADKAGTSNAPRAAVSARSMAGLGALIKQQVKPNYNPPTGGADAASITSTLQIDMARDGTVQSVQVVGHKGVNDTNSAYVRQADDAAIRAIRRSSPLHLPPELYEGGWESITLNFSGAQLQ